MELHDLPPVLDLLVYGVLLYALHQCLFRFPKIYFFIAALILAKVNHTVYPARLDIFWTIFNLVFSASLLLGLFLARKSANFFWLFSGLLIIRGCDIVIYPILKNHGAFFYLWAILMDGLILFLMDRRTLVVSAMASVCRGELQRWAKAAEPYQRESYHEVMLMLIYWVSIIYSVLTGIEYVVYHHYGWPPGFFYKTYSLVKMPLAVIELFILFYLTTGRAVTLIGRQPMH